MTNNSTTERSFEQNNQLQSAQPLTFHSQLIEAWKSDRALLPQMQAPILPQVFESLPGNNAVGVPDTGSHLLAQGHDGFELVDHAKHAHKVHDKLTTGASEIAAHAHDLHKHHSNQFHNHGNVYTCAMFVNRALADAGYKLTYAKGENHNMVHSLDHSLAHNKNFEKVPTHPYKAKVGDVVIFGNHHSGIITAIGSEGPILTYGGSTQTGKTASTPLKLLENSPGFAGAPSHVYRCKSSH